MAEVLLDYSRSQHSYPLLLSNVLAIMGERPDITEYEYDTRRWVLAFTFIPVIFGSRRPYITITAPLTFELREPGMVCGSNTNRNDTHPHLGEGSMCMGNAENLIITALRLNNFSAFMEAIALFTRGYNSRSIAVSHWKDCADEYMLDLLIGDPPPDMAGWDGKRAVVARTGQVIDDWRAVFPRRATQNTYVEYFSRRLH